MRFNSAAWPENSPLKPPPLPGAVHRGKSNEKRREPNGQGIALSDAEPTAMEPIPVSGAWAWVSAYMEVNQ